MKRILSVLTAITLAIGVVGLAGYAIAAEDDPPPACTDAQFDQNDYDGDGVANDVDADRTDSCLCIQPNCADGQTCVDDPETTDEDEAGTGDGIPECDDTGIAYPDE